MFDNDLPWCTYPKEIDKRIAGYWTGKKRTFSEEHKQNLGKSRNQIKEKIQEKLLELKEKQDLFLGIKAKKVSKSLGTKV